MTKAFSTAILALDPFLVIAVLSWVKVLQNMALEEKLRHLQWQKEHHPTEQYQAKVCSGTNK